MLTDTVCVVLHCAACQAIGLRRLSERDALFLPTTACATGTESALAALMHSLKLAPDAVRETRFVSELRLLLLQPLFVERYTFVVTLSGCCSTTPGDGLVWVRCADLDSVRDSCWGPEPWTAAALLCPASQQQHQQQHQQQPELTELRPASLTAPFLPKADGQDREQQDALRQLAAQALLKRHQLRTLYQEFFAHAYPSAFWTLASFRAYVRQAAWAWNGVPADAVTEQDVRRLYLSFVPQQQACLRFADFVAGVACLSPLVKHGGRTGFLRLQRILRFYDDERSASLSLLQVRALRRDLERVNAGRAGVSASCANVSGTPSSSSPSDASQQLRQDCAGLGVEVRRDEPEPRVALQQLVQAVRHARLRGTSALYRLQVDPLRQLLHPVSPARLARCAQHAERDFVVSPHVLALALDGSVRCSAPPPAPDSAPAAAGTALAVVRDMAALLRSRGLDSGTCNCTSNERDWRALPQQQQRQRLSALLSVCREARRLLLTEERVARVPAPVLVFGDTHGNLCDVLCFERLLWPRLPLLPDARLLLLGDYVDRGLQSLEVLLYLLALKVLAPQHVHLLRGNHETRAMHATFTFRSEVLGKSGRDLYDALCAVMDALPVAALVGERVFCCHGGVPAAAAARDQRVSSMRRSVPVPLADVEAQSDVAWQLLWNDPLDDASLAQARADMGAAGLDHLPNVKRGTGFAFGGGAVQRFGAINGTSHLLRGHELVMPGFLLHFGGRALTVFSSSAYVGESNQAACVLLQDGLLTPMQLPTLPPPPPSVDPPSDPDWGCARL